MNKLAEQYLKEMDGGLASRVFADTVEEAIRAFTFLRGNEPEEIFVCQVIDSNRLEDGPSYASIWGFDDGFWMEAHHPALDIDISSYIGGIYYLSIQYEEIEFPDFREEDVSPPEPALVEMRRFDGISERSRLSVEIRTDKVEYSKLSAVGVNCRSLLNIVRTRFRPNLTHPNESTTKTVLS